MKQHNRLHHTTPLFAELVLTVPVPNLFTYRVPDTIRETIKIGQLATVPFGTKKILTGIIMELHSRPVAASYPIKNILSLGSSEKIIHAYQFTLYQWIARYYMCTLGEVIHAALPSGFRLSSKSMIQLNPAFDWPPERVHFSDTEYQVLMHLKHHMATYSDITKLLGTTQAYRIVRSLSAKKSVILFEQIKEKYKPKIEKRVRLTPSFTKRKNLEVLFNELKKKQKQETIVLKYLNLVPVLLDVQSNMNGIGRSVLLQENTSPSSLRALIKTNVLEEFNAIIPRHTPNVPCRSNTNSLSKEQKIAFEHILNIFKKKNTVLLHGITGSGKTEIYIELIKKTLDEGRQALLLIPEIALTTQIVQRLQKALPVPVGVYHSKFSDNERVEIWNGVLSGKLRFIVGVRSSVFLPFDNLGLTIVDEEHDSSYKQTEPAPRYHARDVALIMATHHRHSKTLLGSATPSTESYLQAVQNKYGLVTLNHRFGSAILPEVVFADMRKEQRKKSSKRKFSSLLLKEITYTLKQNKQVLLFQNRRGYAPMIQCEDCQWTPQCVNCSVTLTYHQFNHKTICHYCGYSLSFPPSCPDCNSQRLLTRGYGTERLEEELKLLFENSNIQRMDRDTTTTRRKYETLIADFENNKTQILVGTQMIAKGLDFDNVNLVGIIDADQMRYFPDFRSHERTFQLITQVSGRAGRRKEKGKVIIQTTDPTHELFDYIRCDDVRGFIVSQLQDRRLCGYPPYFRLIEITIKHAYYQKCDQTAQALAERLRAHLPSVKIMGPGHALLSKIRNEFIRTILIKIPRQNKYVEQIKTQLNHLTHSLLSVKEHRASKVIFNVDPVQ